MAATFTPEMDAARRPVVPSAVLGTLIFTVAETMLFVGMISAFTISKAGAPAGSWPVAGQPTLPASSTAINTVALMASGVLLLLSHFGVRKGAPSAKFMAIAAWVLGAAFVLLQGREWAALLSQGLTLTSSRLGAFFYVIVGTHALHAVGALIALAMGVVQVVRGSKDLGTFLGAQTFWYFVVLMWPIIYVRVYF